jgi:hypothetical protein
MIWEIILRDNGAHLSLGAKLLAAEDLHILALYMKVLLRSNSFTRSVDGKIQFPSRGGETR